MIGSISAFFRSGSGLWLFPFVSFTLPYQGKTYCYPKRFFLVHAMEHGNEHRTGVKVVLAHLGIDTLDLDGWNYAFSAGFGKEITTQSWNLPLWHFEDLMSIHKKGLINWEGLHSRERPIRRASDGWALRVRVFEVVLSFEELPFLSVVLPSHTPANSSRGRPRAVERFAKFKRRFSRLDEIESMFLLSHQGELP